MVLELNKKGKGVFLIKEGEDTLGEMEVGVSGDHLTVYHTEVAPKAEGKGLSKQLLAMMVAYARENGLRVIPLCQFVLTQFRKHPDEYADVWEK